MRRLRAVGADRRARPEIGVHAVRGGTAAGEHSLRFLGGWRSLSFATARTAGNLRPRRAAGGGVRKEGRTGAV